MPEVEAPVAFYDSQRLRMWMTREIEPGTVVKSGAFDHQNIAIPMADGVTHPIRVWILRERASIEENLPVRKVLVQHYNQPGRLHDLRQTAVRDVARTSRLAARNLRIIFAELLQPLARQSGSPWLNVACRKTSRDIGADAYFNSEPPQAGQVGFAIRGFGCRRGEVGFAIRRSRYPRSGIVDPLCRCGRCCDCQNRGHERTSSSIHRPLRSRLLGRVYVSQKGFCCPKERQNYLRPAQLDGQTGGVSVLRRVLADPRHGIQGVFIAQPSRPPQGPGIPLEGEVFISRIWCPRRNSAEIIKPQAEAI